MSLILRNGSGNLSLNSTSCILRSEVPLAKCLCVMLTVEYLELTSRVQVLNDRSEVLFDLLDILSDSIAESNMGRITWIIIALILLSVVVTSLEVLFRVEILRR